MSDRPLRIVQVSDTHLSRNRAYFQANWESFLALMDEEKPDLVVHTGDLCFAANADPDDMAFGRHQMARLTVPWCIIPGNHDIGEIPPDLKRGHPLTEAKRAGWLTQFGPDWWERKAGDWCLVGINAQLMGSGLAAEEEQWAWLEATLGRGDGRPVLLFSHKAPFLGDPADRTIHDSAIRPDPRDRLLALLGRADVPFVGCGHNHFHQTVKQGGTRYIWAPATSFVSDLPKPGEDPRAKRVTGFVRYWLEGQGLDWECTEPPCFVRYDMTAWQRAEGSTSTLPPMPLAGLGGL